MHLSYMTKVIKSTLYNPQQLEIFIDLIEDKYNKVFTDYKELAEVISKDFKVHVNENDVWNYYENYYCLEIKDKEIHNKSLGINY